MKPDNYDRNMKLIKMACICIVIAAITIISASLFINNDVFNIRKTNPNSALFDEIFNYHSFGSALIHNNLVYFTYPDSSDEKLRGLFVVDFDGNNKTRLNSFEVSEILGAYGNDIYFVHNQKGIRTVHRINVNHPQLVMGINIGTFPYDELLEKINGNLKLISLPNHELKYGMNDWFIYKSKDLYSNSQTNSGVRTTRIYYGDKIVYETNNQGITLIAAIDDFLYFKESISFGQGYDFNFVKLDLNTSRMIKKERSPISGFGEIGISNGKEILYIASDKRIYNLDVDTLKLEDIGVRLNRFTRGRNRQIITAWYDENRIYICIKYAISNFGTGFSGYRKLDYNLLIIDRDTNKITQNKKLYHFQRGGDYTYLYRKGNSITKVK